MSTLQPLSQDQLATFRKDFQDKEGEINKYISVYLSALAVVTGWIIGPTSKSAITLLVGNNAYNLVFWFAIVFINIVFSTFLAYKGLIIHDIMQFVTYNSPLGDGLLAWESWRRSTQSSTVRVRTMYTITIAAIPSVVAVILMVVLFWFLVQSPQQLITWAKSADGSGNYDLSQVTHARILGWCFWLLLLALHAVPLRMFIESAGPTQQRWQEILALRPDIPRFEKLCPHPFAPSVLQAMATEHTPATQRESIPEGAAPLPPMPTPLPAEPEPPNAATHTSPETTPER
ncbi:hypothetical protein [Paludibaculum fermentans]|uniref:Uncharacterized protein n=1 Tax=Paludibaculum fermentans TaxID=1473598 RepID=A0A7S7NWY0_PALFE|nr:hypothetical protein [Paludibaculum fermentans]QOY91287.1 hypothetical protein IRI77_15465 [Paludibaculum fermentans]